MIDMVRMPPEISTGFTRVTDWGTDVVRLAGRNTERVRTRESPGRVYQAVKGLFTKALIEETDGFLHARFGAFHAFRFWDPTDFTTNPSGRTLAPSMVDQLLGYGDGVRTRFPLRRVYRSTPNELTQRLYPEDRMLPIHGEQDDRLARKIGLAAGTTFNALFAGNSSPIGTFLIDYQTREVVFATAPAMDVAVTWGCYYDWPVTLSEDTDRNFEVTAESWNAQHAPNIGLELMPNENLASDTDDPGGYQRIEWSLGSPLIQKVAGRWVDLLPGVGSLTVTLEEPSRLTPGGPHFVLMCTGYAVDILDELTGGSIYTITAGQRVMFNVKNDGSGNQYFFVIA